MTTTPLAVLGLGFALGLRHALDVDHLAAIATMVARRRSIWRSSLVGAVWGLGHTAALFAAALVVVGLRTDIPPQAARMLELAVAAMLVALGANLLRTVATGRVHAHVHAHGERVHVHPHVHPDGRPDHEHGPGARRPFFVGVVHGLAGSAGVMLLVLATIPSRALALAYVAVFGLGSVGGMIAMSALLAIPALVTAHRWAGADTALRLLAGAGSIAVGLHLAWEIGVAAGVLA